MTPAPQKTQPWYARRLSWQFSWRVETLALVTSLAFSLSSNSVFWRALLSGRDMTLLASWRVAAAMFIVLTCVHFIILVLSCNRWTIKPVLSVLLIANAFAVYFINQYTVYLDPTMLRNVLRTDVAEVKDLLSLSILPHLLLYAVLPLFLLRRASIKPPPGSTRTRRPAPSRERREHPDRRASGPARRSRRAA